MTPPPILAPSKSPAGCHPNAAARSSARSPASKHYCSVAETNVKKENDYLKKNKPATFQALLLLATLVLGFFALARHHMVSFSVLSISIIP
jgi:hypothetical protein